jgi:hypothetical protein
VTPLAPERPMARDPRHEAAVPASPVTGAAVLPVATAATSLAHR